MSNFVTLGMDGKPVEINSEIEEKISEIFNEQYEYIFSGDGEYLKRLDESFNVLKVSLITLLMPYIFAGANYAIGLIRTQFPGYDEDVSEELLRSFSEHIDQSIRKIHETTRKRLIALLEVDPHLLSAESYKISVIGNRPFVINEYEGVFLFNRGIIEVLKKSRFAYFVKWNTSNDEKVCAVCKPLNGVIMPLSQATIPPLHFGCRCKLAFVLDRRLLMQRYKT